MTIKGLTQAQVDDAAAKAKADARKAEILATLDAIDRKGSRAARASALGKSTKADKDELEALEAQAEALRTEYRSIT